MSQSYSLDTVTLDGDSAGSVTSSEESDVSENPVDTFRREKGNSSNGDIQERVYEDRDLSVDVKLSNARIYNIGELNTADGVTLGVVTNDVNENAVRKSANSTHNDNISPNGNDQTGETKNNEYRCNDKSNEQTKNVCVVDGDDAEEQVRGEKTIESNDNDKSNEQVIGDDDDIHLIQKRRCSVDDHRKPKPKSCLTPPRERWERSKVNLGKRVHWKRTTQVTMKWRRAFAMVRAELRAGNHYHGRRHKLFKNKKRSIVTFDFGRVSKRFPCTRCGRVVSLFYRWFHIHAYSTEQCQFS